MNSASELFFLADRELWLITAQDNERRGGLIATFVCHASLPPELPRVLVAVAKQHFTWQLIEASGLFTLHLLAEANLDLVWRFALQSGHDVDKLADIDTQPTSLGSPRLSGTLGWAECRVEARWDTGDRTLYLAEITATEIERHDPPLTIKRLLQVAPPEKLAQMRDLRERDSQVDAAAILAWRQQSALTAARRLSPLP